MSKEDPRCRCCGKDLDHAPINLETEVCLICEPIGTGSNTPRDGVGCTKLIGCMEAVLSNIKKLTDAAIEADEMLLAQRLARIEMWLSTSLNARRSQKPIAPHH